VTLVGFGVYACVDKDNLGLKLEITIKKNQGEISEKAIDWHRKLNLKGRSSLQSMGVMGLLYADWN
jgi:hypothetical protein